MSKGTFFDAAAEIVLLTINLTFINLIRSNKSYSFTNIFDRERKLMESYKNGTKSVKGVKIL